ncbi:hypothetical protein PYV61_25535, partial [Roseisolibacter sp. H3M3-2]
ALAALPACAPAGAGEAWLDGALAAVGESGRPSGAYGPGPGAPPPRLVVRALLLLVPPPERP